MELILSSCEKKPGEATMSSLSPEHPPSASLHLLQTASKSFNSCPWDLTPTSSNVVASSKSNVATSGSRLSYMDLLTSSLRNDISSTELMVDVSIDNGQKGLEDRFSITRESYDVRAHTLPAKLFHDCSAEQERNADISRSSKWSNFKKFFLRASSKVQLTKGKKPSTNTSKCSQCGPATAESGTQTQNNYKRGVDDSTNTKGLDLESKSKTERQMRDEDMCSVGSTKKPAAAEVSKASRNTHKQMSWARLTISRRVKKTQVDGNSNENRIAPFEGMMPNLHPSKTSYNMGLPTKKWYTKGTGFFKEDPWDYSNIEDNWAYKDVIRSTKDDWRCVGYTKDDWAQ